VLAHGIAEGQWFIEGNKRAALAALTHVPAGQRPSLRASQEERARWILDLAAPARTAEEKVRELGTRLRQSTIPHPDVIDEA